MVPEKGRHLEPINVQDYEGLARAKMDPAAWAYYADGADDRVTLRGERRAFERLRILPRVLRGVEDPDLGTTMLGTPISAPIAISPTGVHGMAHPEGECATARAAGSAGTLMALSTVSSCSLEEVAAAATGPLWFQVYIYRDRGFAERLVRRAERAGYEALVLTVDSPRWGRKERSMRVEDEIPPDLYATSIDGEIESVDQAPVALTWDDVAWLRAISPLPVVLKGILHPEDARLAVEHGAAGIVVSTHGGRQLDTVVPGIEAMPAVVEAVGGRAEVYLDGGIRRGTDVLKALALGAQAVFVGRPVLWGLAAAGESGVRRVLDMLRGELELALALAGQPGVGDVDAALVVRDL